VARRCVLLAPTRTDAACPIPLRDGLSRLARKPRLCGRIRPRMRPTVPETPALAVHVPLPFHSSPKRAVLTTLGIDGIPPHGRDAAAAGGPAWLLGTALAPRIAGERQQERAGIRTTCWCWCFW
jgi:hypothetical protein